MTFFNFGKEQVPYVPTFDSPDFIEIKNLYPSIQPGGQYRPPGCRAQYRVAIVVPFRNRTHHLKTLLLNLHHFLIKQQLEYGIYVVDQALPGTFNKGMLMNIGYLEALKRKNYQCVIFHDVDLIPEDVRNIYSCPRHPRHLAAAVDKFNYRFKGHLTKFGGVVALTRQHMRAVNGFSNLFFGWGGEDDDIEWRLHFAGLKRTQYLNRIARYSMIKHSRDASNPRNVNRFYVLTSVGKRMRFDGLSNLDHFEVQMVEEFPTHTRIQVYIDEQAAKNSLEYKLWVDQTTCSNLATCMILIGRLLI